MNDAVRDPSGQALSATPTEPLRVSSLTGNDPSRLDEAIALAVASHRGQVDKGGEPYILHPLRVMLACQSETTRIAAVLHDTVEDCGLELSLIRHRFGIGIADAVEALTRRDGETYSVFIERCAANRIALVVKLADIADNMDLYRLKREPTADDLRRHNRYADARNVLMKAKMAARDSDEHRNGEDREDGLSGEAMPARAREGIAKNTAP